MTPDEATLDQEIIDALKGAARCAVPPALDQRVAQRLAASAGILGLGTAVSAGSQAAAISAASVSTTAAAASVPAVKLLTLASLGKTLALGMALGSTVGFGLHVTFRPVAAPATRSRPAEVVAPPAPIVTPNSRHPGSAARTPSADDPSLAEPPLERPRAAPLEPRANPSPELPREPPPAPGAGLAEQQALLDDARAALRRGHGEAALAAIRRHSAEFPSTAFAEEREAVAIKALVLLGKASEARARTERFDARFPKSLLRPSLHAALGEPSNSAESVTDQAASSQTTSDE